MAEKRDYYEILGVPKTADDKEIKKAYRQLALKFHPDRNPGDAAAEASFKEASEAYAVLSDADKRAAYDRFGHAGVGAGAGPGGAGFDPNDIFSQFGDIFSDLFGQQRQRDPNGPARGNDLQMAIEVNFDVAVHGTKRTITVPRKVACGTCSGSGAKPGTQPKRCTQCNGTGQMRLNQGFLTLQTTCNQCRGRGTVIAEPCGDCRGTGQKVEKSELVVNIPAGIDSGNRIRYGGKGEEGRRGGPAGDLYVVVNVKDSEIFHREGPDLLLELPVDFSIAALGGRVDIPTLDGTRPLEIEGGTQHATRKVLRGQGLARLDGRGRGDLVVELQIQIPRKLTRKQRELIESYQQEASITATSHTRPGLFDKLKALFEKPPEQSG